MERPSYRLDSVDVGESTGVVVSSVTLRKDFPGVEERTFTCSRHDPCPCEQDCRCESDCGRYRHCSCDSECRRDCSGHEPSFTP